MSKYAYPAVFSEDEGGYSVRFPDLSGCFTCGDDVADALGMAEDALASWLYEAEKEGDAFPTPTPIKEVPIGDDEFSTYVYADTLEYRKFFESRAVKKTLSVPQWLNETALAAGVNFSQVLQDALKERLGVT